MYFVTLTIFLFSDCFSKNKGNKNNVICLCTAKMLKTDVRYFFFSFRICVINLEDVHTANILKMTVDIKLPHKINIGDVHLYCTWFWSQKFAVKILTKF